METEVKEEVVVETTDENQEIDYKSKFEESEKEANRLNSIIQKHKDKKTTKVEKSEAQAFGKEDVVKMLEDNAFYSANPEMSEYKEQIDKFTSNGDISLEQAKTLVLQGDPTIANRKNANNANITEGASGGGTQSYSQEDLYNLGQKDPALKRKAMEEISSGKAIETA